MTKKIDIDAIKMKDVLKMESETIERPRQGNRLSEQDFEKQFLSDHKVCHTSSDYPDVMSFMEAINPNMSESLRLAIQNEIAKFKK